MVRLVFELSTSTTMHLKDFDSGKEGMVAFVKGVLSGRMRDEADVMREHRPELVIADQATWVSTVT